jgi:hypothetical protein
MYFQTRRIRMHGLISKDEELKASSVYIGYLILKRLNKKKDNRITIFDLVEELKEHKVIHYRQILFALMFLHTCGVIDFVEPYIYKLHVESSQIVTYEQDQPTLF